MAIEKNFQFYKDDFLKKDVKGLEDFKDEKTDEIFEAVWKFFIENENDPHLKIDVNKIPEKDMELVKKFYEGTLTEDELNKRLEVDTGLHSNSPNYNLIAALKNKLLSAEAEKKLKNKRKTV